MMVIQHFTRGKNLTFHCNKQANKFFSGKLFENHASFGNQSRLSSSKKPFGGRQKHKEGIMEPPKLDLNPSKNSVLHEKAARAAELHAELNSLLDKQAKRRAEELKRPFGAGFLEFVKGSKSEMINIFAAFMCVVLAYQIAVIRRGAKNLVEQAEQREVKVEELMSVLRKMSSDEFSAHLASKCSEVLHKSESISNQQGRFIEWFKKEKINNNKSSSKDNINSTIFNILTLELQKEIGDIALTSPELSEKKMKSLRAEMETREEKRNKMDTNFNDLNGTSDKLGQKSHESLDGMEELIAAVQTSVEADSNHTVVKRKKGFI